MVADRPLLGILFILGFCVFAPLGDAAAKSIALSTPLLVLLLARYIVQGLLPLPLIIVTGRQLRMSPRVVRVIITRSMVNIAGSAAMYAALRYLPLADALAIAFVYPFIMLLMGWTLLKEQVGIRRLLACSVGFIGTLLIIQPSFAAVGLPALLPLLVAFLFASVVLLTRQIAKDYDPVSLQSVSGLTSGLILMVIWALAGGANIPDLQFTVPTTDQMITLLMVGVLGTLAHLAMSYAVRFAPSATLAPMQYVELPVATVIGWAMFGELPNGMATAGILITIIAGLAVILFEHKAVKSALG